MPPFVSRKRHHSDSPDERPAKRLSSSVQRGTAKPKPPAARARVSKDAATPGVLEDSSSSGDDLSSVTSADEKPHQKAAAEDSDEEDFDWEDAIPDAGLGSTEAPEAPEPSGDLEIDLNPAARQHWSAKSKGTTDGKKKGPTKRDRERRILSHKLHVQFLLWHNCIRNGWACDKQVQETLVEALPEGMKKEVERWRKAMGWAIDGDQDDSTVKDKGKGNSKGAKKTGKKGKTRQTKDETPVKKRAARDWGDDATRLEPGVPNLSGGDPLLRLLRSLSSYWKKRFKVSTPALRKIGHMDVATLAEVTASFETSPLNGNIHGERIDDKDKFRDCARKMEGSRDVGAQLFTALLRGLKIETRMVASLQPVGFGWNKNEDANYKRLEKAVAGRQNPVKGKKTNHSELDNTENDSSELSDVSFEDSVLSKINSRKNAIDTDLEFPTYWAEALSPVSQTYIPVDPLVRSIIASNGDALTSFEPVGKTAERSKQVIAYVVAYATDGSAKDVTVRYLKRHQLPGKTKAYRLPVEKVPVLNSRGKVKKHEDADWFKQVMSLYTKSDQSRTTADDIEDQGVLRPQKPAQKTTGQDKPETLQYYKNSADYVLERHLRREEALLPHAEPVKHFNTGKGDKAESIPVYRRSEVVACKTSESWHKEGREVQSGQQPLKFVPFRAVTIMRKREIEETERETGEKAMQGLYSKAQTQWIIPPPIENGVIPRNAFGNIDVYVPSMVPEGAVHVPLKSTAKVCKKLDIDFAEACVGFEFGKQRAVPVLRGVVVARENEQLVRDAWREEEKARAIKENEKRTKLVLGLWKKFLTGLRIMERMRSEYKDIDVLPDEVNPFTNQRKKMVKHAEKEDDSGSLNTDPSTVMDRQQFAEQAQAAGGFFRDGDEGIDDVGSDQKVDHQQGGLIMEEDDQPGGFFVEHDADDTYRDLGSQNGTSVPTSLQAANRLGSEVGSRTALGLDGNSPQHPNQLKAHEISLKPQNSGHPTRQKRERLPEPESSENVGSGADDKTDSLDESNVSSVDNGPVAQNSSGPKKTINFSAGGRSDTQMPKGRTRPQRQAATRSAKKVKSHYFDHASENSDQDTPSKATRRSTRARGRR